MVLSRSRNTLKEVDELVRHLKYRARMDERSEDIRLMTYHGSKGLEADAVFILRDCEQLTSPDWLNQAYALANLETIIRAKLRCYGFFDESKGGVKSFPKASEKIDKRQAYFSDFRK